MKLENQVTSLKYSKKLKELGFKQESLWYWWVIHSYPKVEHPKKYNKKHWDSIDYEIRSEDESEHNWGYEDKLYSAYTVAELGEMLPRSYKNKDGTWFLRFGQMLSEIYYICYSHGERKHDRTHHEKDKTEANVRAKMLIYLKENKLI